MEQRYRAIFEAMESGVVVCEPLADNSDFSIIDLNRAGESMSSVSKDEAIGRRFSSIFADIDKFGLTACLWRVYRTGNPERLPPFHYKVENRDRWLQYFVDKLPNGEIVAICDDITGAKAAEFELQLSEERWKFALEGSGDGVWDWDARTNEVFFSDRWKSMLGYEPSEIGNNLQEWDSRLHPDDRKQCYSDLDRLLTGESRTYENEHRLMCKDGSYKWILDRGKVMERDNESRPIRIIGTHTDISERKRMEEALKKSEEERFRTVSDFAYDWEYWINPEGELLYVSPSCERITGYRPDEFVANPLLLTEIIHPDDKSLTADHLGSVSPTGPRHIDFRIITRSGEIRWIGHVCQPVYRDDRTWLGRRASNRDVTYLKHIEQALQNKTEDLERSNKDLEQFAYVAAHDLREPLVAVAAYLKILERHSNSHANENTLKCITKALNLVLRMDNMLQTLLSHSRIMQTSVPPETIDSNICMADALSNLAFSIEKSGAVITNDNLPPVRINHSHLVTVFQNLVGNSIKYKKSEPPQIHIGCQIKENEYQFSVTDNGIGIEPPYLDRIFKMFERAHELSGREGTGIGLSTCRKIIERNGGRMWVESAAGEGSTFFFTLPKNG